MHTQRWCKVGCALTVFLFGFLVGLVCETVKSQGQTGRNYRQVENESSSGWNATECAWKRQRQEAESTAEAQRGEETELSSRQRSESLTCQRDFGGAVWSVAAVAAAAAAKWIPERKVLGKVSHRYFDADSHFPHDSASRLNRIRDVLSSDGCARRETKRAGRAGFLQRTRKLCKHPEWPRLVWDYLS